MKTNLLKSIKVLVVLLAALSLSAQQGPTLYDYDDNAQGWVKGFGAGTVAWDGTEGVLGDGAITLERLTNPNANFRRGQGGDPAFVVIDRAVYNFMRIRYKNETAATNFRIQGQSRVPRASELDPYNTPANFPNTVFGGLTNFTPAGSTEFSTIFIDLSFIPAGNEVTRLDILVRGGTVVSGVVQDDPMGSKMIIDEIELLSALPPLTESEYVRNPDWEGPTQLDHITGPTSEMSRSLSTSEQQNGLTSLKLEFTQDATQINWLFSSFSKVYPSDFNPGSEMEITMWVKKTTNYDRNFKVNVRNKLSNDGDDTGITRPIQTVEATYVNGPGEWEQLTFNLVSSDAFDEVEFWFSIDWEDGDPDNTNAMNEDIIYIDNIVASPIVNGTLGVEDINKDDASLKLFPNPVRDVLRIKSDNSRAISKIEIYSLLGKRVLSTEQTESINVSALSPGVYVSKIYGDNDAVSTKRFIKQ